MDLHSCTPECAQAGRLGHPCVHGWEGCVPACVCACVARAGRRGSGHYYCPTGDKDFRMRSLADGGRQPLTRQICLICPFLQPVHPVHVRVPEGALEVQLCRRGRGLSITTRPVMWCAGLSQYSRRARLRLPYLRQQERSPFSLNCFLPFSSTGQPTLRGSCPHTERTVGLGHSLQEPQHSFSTGFCLFCN